MPRRKRVIVESGDTADELVNLGFTDVRVVPNLSDDIDVQDYPVRKRKTAKERRDLD